MQNLFHKSQAKVIHGNVVVGTLSVAGTCENREGFSPNCEFGISRGCASVRRNGYVISSSTMTEMGQIIGETAAIIVHERHIRCNILNIAMVCVT